MTSRLPSRIIFTAFSTSTRPASSTFSLMATELQTRSYSAPGEGAIPPSKAKYVPTSGTYPKGFRAAAVHVGVKPSNTRFDDLALIVSDVPASAAATFTTNRFQAAPVRVSKDVLKTREGEGIRAVVVNSGCANAVTGKQGLQDAVQMGEETSKLVDEAWNSDGKGGRAIVMSTGVIGQQLPIRKILANVPLAHSSLGSDHTHWSKVSRAICTTDTFPKLMSMEFALPGSSVSYRLAGMTKGAGMIHPNMATLLGIICTDAPIAAPALSKMLKSAVDSSFNSISIDGDTSTNDTVAMLANGAAGGLSTITGPESAGFAEMQEALTNFATKLSQLVVRDGEGATKFVTIRVVGAKSKEDAKRVASTIARSPLVKTALYGRDANWGRILCATGYAEGVSEGGVVPEETSVSFIPTDGSTELKLLVKGEPEKVNEERAAEILKDEDLEILVRLSETDGEEAVYWTCDFSHEYVTINGDYRT